MAVVAVVIMAIMGSSCAIKAVFAFSVPEEAPPQLGRLVGGAIKGNPKGGKPTGRIPEGSMDGLAVG